jgi:hypothetical protein
MLESCSGTEVLTQATDGLLCAQVADVVAIAQLIVLVYSWKMFFTFSRVSGARI